MNENISIRISDTQMFLKTSFLTWMLFIQNTNAYFSAGSIYPDLSMEFHRHFKPSSLCFQAQDLSSCALFLCLVSWEGSQVTGWYPPPSWFWSAFQMTLAHNWDHWLEHGTKDMAGKLRKKYKFTPTSGHTTLASSRCGGSHAWTELETHCRFVLPCFQCHS